MSKRALLWLIAAATMAFFYIAASYSGSGACSTLDFTKWVYRCEVLPRLAALLIGLVPTLVLVYFAEKGQPDPALSALYGWLFPKPQPASGPRPTSQQHRVPLFPSGTYKCQECGYETRSSTEAISHNRSHDSHKVTGGASATQTVAAEAAYGFGPNQQAPQAAPAPVVPAHPSGFQYKTCPDCAEEVRFAARKCRFCGYEFVDAAASGLGA